MARELLRIATPTNVGALQSIIDMLDANKVGDVDDVFAIRVRHYNGALIFEEADVAAPTLPEQAGTES